jgi:hypothetical protein
LRAKTLPQHLHISLTAVVTVHTGNSTECNEWRARRADSLAAICEPNVSKCGSLKGLHSVYRDIFTFLYGLNFIVCLGVLYPVRDNKKGDSYPGSTGEDQQQFTRNRISAGSRPGVRCARAKRFFIP